MKPGEHVLGLLGLLALGMVACARDEPSIAISFPNENVRSAMRRIAVEVHESDGRTCVDFLGRAAIGQDLEGASVRGVFDYPFAEQVLARVGRGNPIIYVLGYASREEDAPAIVEGCTDRFDSEGSVEASTDVPVDLSIVIPTETRLEKIAGDPQVVRPGDDTPAPLKVRVESTARNQVSYSIPGVSIEFVSAEDGFMISSAFGAEGSDRYTTTTDANGEAEARVRAPMRSSTAIVVARAPLLVDAMATTHEQEFHITAAAPVSFARKTVVAGSGSGVVIATALGSMTGAGKADLAVVRCDSTEPNCRPGQDGAGSPGRTSLAVHPDLRVQRGSGPLAIAPLPDGAGILPSGIVVADFAPGGDGSDDLAILNSRRADCQDRFCEGSEVLIFRVVAGVVSLHHRTTLTASNAIGLSAYRLAGHGFMNLAAAGQGRARNPRVCGRANACLPSVRPAGQGSLDAGFVSCEDRPSECGCPPTERCECATCSETRELGRCVSRDKIVDVLVNRFDSEGDLWNRGGCQDLRASCDQSEPETSLCSCGDAFRLNRCSRKDSCGCAVPERVYIGDPGVPSFPYGVAAGTLQNGNDWDLVVPSDRGLELIEGRPASESFQWRTQPIVNSPVHAALIANLDSTVDAAPDVVWYARPTGAAPPCLDGINFLRSCPIWSPPPDGTRSQGCLGIYFTGGEKSVFDVRAPTAGGCRRYNMTFVPESMCVGDFNGDGTTDVAVASSEVARVAIYSGDGLGGLLDPPETVDLPGVDPRGGPLACGDIDLDARDDIVVVHKIRGDIYVLASSASQ